MPYDPKLGPGNEYFVDEAKGLVYQIDSKGKRHYVSPAAMTPAQLRMSQQEQATGQPRDADEFLAAGFDRSTIPRGGFFRGGGQWDAQKGKFNQPINWGNLAALGIGGAIGAPAIAGMLGGGGAAGGAAAGSTLPATGLPGAASGMLSAGSIGAGMGSGSLGAGTMAAGGLGSMGTAASGAGGGGMFGKMAGEATEGLGGRAAQAAIAGLAGLPGLMGGGPSQEEEALMKQLRDILAQQQRRTTSQDPLFDAVTRMAGQLMPTSSWGSGGNPYGS